MTATKEELKEFEVDVVPISLIQVTNRHRKDYGNIEELASTFDEAGLAQPMAVVRLESSEKGYQYELLAGGRRFAACMLAKIVKVPIRIYPSSLDPHQRALIEHVENVQRKDFTVEEQLASIEAVHKAKVAVHGEKWSTAKDATGWSQKMTAELVGMSPSKTSDLLRLAEKAKEHPEIAKAKTIVDAKKIAKSIDKSAQKSAKAKQLSDEAQKKNKDDERRRLNDCFIINDCLKGMPSLPSESFDIVEIDPPYAIDFVDMKKKGKSAGSTVIEYTEVDRQEYIGFMTKVLTESVRLMKPDAWLILWHANDWEQPLFTICKELGLRGRMLPAIWEKPNTASMTMRPKEYLARGYEQFLYFSKGNAEINKQGRSDVFTFKGVPSTQRSHPTERPIELVQEILDTFHGRGGTILVPFAGSGNTLLAAANLHITGIGYDLSQVYKDTFTYKVYTETAGNYSSYTVPAAPTGTSGK